MSLSYHALRPFSHGKCRDPSSRQPAQLEIRLVPFAQAVVAPSVSTIELFYVYAGHCCTTLAVKITQHVMREVQSRSGVLPL